MSSPRLGPLTPQSGVARRLSRKKGRNSRRALEMERSRLVLWCASRMSQKLRAKVQPEDVTQEVLVALHKALPALDTSGGRRAFLKLVFRVAENRVRDFAECCEPRHSSDLVRISDTGRAGGRARPRSGPRASRESTREGEEPPTPLSPRRAPAWPLCQRSWAGTSHRADVPNGSEGPP